MGTARIAIQKLTVEHIALWVKQCARNNREAETFIDIKSKKIFTDKTRLLFNNLNPAQITKISNALHQNILPNLVTIQVIEVCKDFLKREIVLRKFSETIEEVISLMKDLNIDKETCIKNFSSNLPNIISGWM